MQKLKKALVVGVMSLTVLSMAVVVAPESNAAAVAGDLIKMNGLSSVYYLGTDGKRYVFPNEKTYFSWYSDFSSVVTVPQAELESYPLGKNVTVRPGTQLIKITTNPKVFAVEPGGNLVHVADEATAKTLWGNDWAKRVIDISDAFFTNYTETTRQVTASAYPAGSLVKFGDAADVYYIDTDGKARKIADEASFVANRFRFSDVVTATIAMPTAGADIAGKESALSDTASGAGGQAGAGSGLTVSLAGDTAGSQDIPSPSSLVPFVTVNLTASADGAVMVNGLTFTRKGTGPAADFDGGFLFVGDERLTNKRSVNTSDNIISFSALNLSIPAGMTKQVTLKMNTTSGVTGKHYFQLASASAVATNGALVSGSFPISGNQMAYSNTAAATVTFDGTGAGGTKKIGETGVILSEFDIANNNQEIVKVYRIRLKNIDDAGNAAVNNLSLTIDGNVVASGVSLVDKYADFKLDTPLEIGKNETLSAEVKGDIIDDIGKEVDFVINNDGDVDVRGTAYGDFYSAMIIRTAYDSATEGGKITIAGSEINVSFDGPAAADTKDDVKDLVLANFKIKSNNLDVEFETLRVTLTMGSASTTANLDNIEMVDSANGVSYSVSDPTASLTSHDLDFENVYLTKGVQYNFQIRADVPDGVYAGETYAASIDFSTGQTARFQDADETLVVTGDYSSSGLTGKTMTVAAPVLYYSKVATNDSTVVKDSKGVLLYKGKLAANSVDDVKVTRIPVDFTVGDLSANTIATDWSRIYLYKVNADGTETKLDDETSLSVDSINFSGFTLEIKKGLSNGVYFMIRGDAKTTPTGTTTEVALGSASSFTAKDSDNNAITPTSSNGTGNSHVTTVVTEGTYTLIIDTNETGLNTAQNVLAGGMRLVGRLKATAQKEPMIIEDLAIHNFGTAANDTLGRIYVYDNKELSGTPLGSADVNSSAVALLEDINVEIPTTGSKYLYLGGYVKGIDYSASPSSDATADATTTIALHPISTSSKIKGKTTGTEITFSEGVNMTTTVYSATSTVMGATVSAVTTSFADATLSNGLSKTIFSFKVTAPASTNRDYDGDALATKLNTVMFTISTSTVTASNFKIERVSGANSAVAASVAHGAGTLTVNFGTTYGANTDLDINPGETAEYKLIADIAGGDGSGDSIQVIINNINTDLTYVHNTGVSGVDAANSIAVYPLLSGDTTIDGGTLSN